MLLAIDIGNTNVTLGVFRESKLLGTWRIKTDAQKMPDEYAVLLQGMLPFKGISIPELNSAAICSVVPPLTGVFENLCRTYLNVAPLVVGAGTKTGVRIQYDNPRDVGADRIVDAAAAYHLYGGPTIVVDFGTATVFDAISKDGDYLGGAIAPGLNVAANALFQSTSKLPRVELVRPKSAIGRSTTTSIQSGLIFGYTGLVEGLVRRFKEELGAESKVVATGGLAPLIAQEVAIFDQVNPDLTLIGLRLIFEMNDKE